MVTTIFHGVLIICCLLLDERFRFSRALILLGSGWAIIVLPLYRLVFHVLKLKSFRLDIRKTKKIAIVGHLAEAKRVKQLLEKTQIRSELAGFISLDKTDKDENYIGELDQLKEIIRINTIDEVVFCAENISSAQIIRAMLDLTQLEIDFKIAPPESLSIIGSNSIHTAGDLYVVSVNAISKPSNKGKKRLLDIGFSIVFLLLSPFLIWFYKNKVYFVSNIFNVLFGKKSWIGYITEKETFETLPNLKDGVLSPGDLFSELSLDKEKVSQLNMLYARDYSLHTDTEILLKAWKNMDR